jgi:hypothetical protein
MTMTVSLAETLRDFEFQPGRIYRCEVRGHNVELRVVGPQEDGKDSESAIPESDVTLEPWLELPESACRARGVSRLGPALLPDRPFIPDNWEDA